MDSREGFPAHPSNGISDLNPTVGPTITPYVLPTHQPIVVEEKDASGIPFLDGQGGNQPFALRFQMSAPKVCQGDGGKDVGVVKKEGLLLPEVV